MLTILAAGLVVLALISYSLQIKGTALMNKTILHGVFAFSFVVASSFSSLVMAGTVDAGNGWKCTADKIKNAKYDGGSRAYIHLDPYGRGDKYRVTLNAAKTEASGKTGNDTPFVCKKG